MSNIGRTHIWIVGILALLFFAVIFLFSGFLNRQGLTTLFTDAGDLVAILSVLATIIGAVFGIEIAASGKKEAGIAEGIANTQQHQVDLAKADLEQVSELVKDLLNDMPDPHTIAPAEFQSSQSRIKEKLQRLKSSLSKIEGKIESITR